MIILPRSSSCPRGSFILEESLETPRVEGTPSERKSWAGGHGLPGCAEEEQVWRAGVSEHP